MAMFASMEIYKNLYSNELNQGLLKKLGRNDKCQGVNEIRYDANDTLTSVYLNYQKY